MTRHRGVGTKSALIDTSEIAPVASPQLPAVGVRLSGASTATADAAVVVGRLEGCDDGAAVKAALADRLVVVLALLQPANSTRTNTRKTALRRRSTATHAGSSIIWAVASC